MIRHAILLLFACCSTAAAAETSSPSYPDPVRFMRETVDTYRAMSSYRDRGHLVQTLKSSPSDDSVAAITQDFVTLFQRPDKFLFAWTTTDNFSGDEKDQDAIGSDGTTVWASWSSQDHNAPKVLQDFDTAVASATGISHGAAHSLFALLSERVSGFRVDELTKLQIVRSKTWDGVECYVVRGRQLEDVHELWIGKKDHLIRKGTDTRPDGAVTTVERSNIAVDQEISAAEFTWRKR